VALQGLLFHSIFEPGLKWVPTEVSVPDSVGSVLLTSLIGREKKYLLIEEPCDRLRIETHPDEWGVVALG